MIVGRRNPFFLQEEPQGIQFPVQMARQLTRLVFPFVAQTNEAKKASV
jgi:hypothetical protein